MLGDPDYISWARYGTSSDEEHEEFSIAKGAVRNVLLNVILRFAARRTFPGEQTEFDRVNYAIDFDKGLYLLRQTKRRVPSVKGETETRTLKNWKTTEREFVTKDLDEMVGIIFGKDAGVEASELMRLEDVARALWASPELGDMAGEILETFIEEITMIADRDDRMFGPDPEATLLAISAMTGV